MARWRGVLKVPICADEGGFLRVAASLRLSSASGKLTVPSANAILFTGDRVQGTGNPVIERLSDAINVADILVSKLGASANAWVVEPSTFNGPFAIYKEFIPSLNRWGEPESYDPENFPASTATVTLLSRCLIQVESNISGRPEISPTLLEPGSVSVLSLPRTIVLGFSKGGTVLNQILTELAHLGSQRVASSILEDERLSVLCALEGNSLIPCSWDMFLSTIYEIHFVDVGLNSAGAYLTEGIVIRKIAQGLMQRAVGLRVIFHGTPRQWCDMNRPWIKNEKDVLLEAFQGESGSCEGKLIAEEKFYFADSPPSLQMHFEVIERMDLS